jgi:hypothetical protein
MRGDDVFDAWNARLGSFQDLVVVVRRETAGQRLDSRARPLGGNVEVPAGTRVLYVETRYDAMRPDQAVHTVKVVSGSGTGTWVGLFDVVGARPLPWE